MANVYRLGLAGLSLMALSACLNGTSDLDRAAIGALAGCAVGEILDDGKCIAGAAVGAAGGALADDAGLVR